MLGWLFGLLWMAALRAWLLGHPGLDSDTLVVADLWRDLVQGGHLGDWTLCPHPYIFPDLGLFALASCFSKDLVNEQTVYGLELGFLMWWFLAGMMGQLWPVSGSQARSYSAAGLMILLPFLTEANGLGGVFYPGYHGGAVLCGLAWSGWVLAQDRRLSSWSGVVWTGLLLGAVWASDQITPVWVLLPGLGLSLGSQGRSRRRIFAAALVSAAARWAIMAWWKLQGMQVAHFEWGYFWAHAGANLAAVGTLAPAFVAGILGPLALVLSALGLLWSLGERHGGDQWVGLGIVVLLLSGPALGVMEGSLQGRYFFGLIWLAAPLVPLLCSLRWQGNPLPLLVCALTGLLWLGFAQAPPAQAQAALQAQWMDQTFASKGLDRGFADYGHARPLSLLSGLGLALTPVATMGRGLQLYTWSTDRARFGPLQRRPAFVVLNGLDADQVRATLGPPAGLLLGEGLTVWLYFDHWPKDTKQGVSL
jgi:hypothetical protein